jgi:cyclase
MQRISISFLTGLFVLISSSAVIGQDMDSVKIITTPVTANIYMIQGQGGNIAAINGKDGLVLIDDQFAPLSQKIKTALRAINPQPARFVINTHFHFDHTGGNQNFAGDGAIIVAQENSRRRMTIDQFITAFKIAQKASDPDALPKITFTDSLRLYLNNETFQVIHIKNAHTDGDAIIFFKESNVLHAGDVFVRYGLPLIDQEHGGGIDGMINGVKRMLLLVNENTVIIPGHGGLAKKKDLQDYLTMLQTIRSRIAKLMKEGKTLKEIIATKPVDDFPAAFLREVFVETVYNSLKK